MTKLAETEFFDLSRYLPKNVADFLQQDYHGNSVQRWLTAVLVSIAVFLLLGITKRLILARLKHLAAKTETTVDDLLIDLVERTKRLFLFVVALWIAHHSLDWTELRGKTPETPAKIEVAIQYAIIVGLWLQVGFWGRGLVHYGIQQLVKGKSSDDPARTMGVTVLGFIGHLVVWSIVVLSALQHMGMPVGSLIASLGVGGIAVALALQNVLGDLFASITILLDKPFVVGDGVQVGDFAGTIERIGVKTTRLRSVNGEEIVMGNNDLVSSRTRNFKRLAERRVMTNISIVYDTPAATVERVPAMIKEIITSLPNVRFDRAHFKSFGDSALQFEFVYFSLSQDYAAMMDAQQAVNLAILKRFAAEGIEFAYPTQTVRHVGATIQPTQHDVDGDSASD